MKVAIVTIYDFYNHGNRLQNYALEQELTKLGCEVETLAIASQKAFPFLLKLSKFFCCFPMCKRINNSMKFSKESLHEIKIDKFSDEMLEELAKKYDCIFIGSDQVWNPLYIANKNVSMLLFAPSEKCASYAPSFGVSKLPEKELEYYKNGLEHIKYLSVRENDGQKLIEDIAHKNSTLVLDPTLLISKDEWQKFGEKPKKMPKDYILTYFLGETKEYKKKVKEIARANNLKIVNINNSMDKYYKINPRQFMYLMANARLVCTNSFHGHALSIALEKPFVSFSTLKNTGSRIQTLLKLVGLENRNWTVLNESEYFEIDYTKANERLLKNREESENFIKSVLDDVKKETKL